MSNDAQDLLLSRLASGEWISGAGLAEQLGISREALSRRMSKLETQLDLALERQAGRGYRLAQPLDLLDEGRLQAALQGVLQAGQIAVLQSIDSSNRYLVDHPQVRLCLAEHQSGGRGRRGRQWHSPFGENLYLSLRVRLDHWPSRLPALGLALGVDLCAMLRQRWQIPMQLKWPNDLYLNGRKCGGMLIEQRGEAQGYCELIIGLGLNARMRQADIDQAWTSLLNEGHDIERNALASAVTQCLLSSLDQLDDGKLAQQLARFADYDVYFRQAVVLQAAEQQLHGQAEGIDDWGRLRLRTEHGLELISVGDLSLRSAS